MELAILLGVGVRECLVLSVVWEFTIASTRNIAETLRLRNDDVLAVIHSLVLKELVKYHRTIEIPTRSGPQSMKMWTLTGTGQRKIIEWEAGKRQAPPAAGNRG